MGNTFVERMEAELTDLAEKLVKIGIFLDGEVYQAMDPAKQDLMVRQRAAMVDYKEALAARLKLEKAAL